MGLIIFTRAKCFPYLEMPSLIAITELQKKSFADCKFPQQWKTAKGRCIHKQGSQIDCENYLPISMLSLVCQQLDAFLEHHNLPSNSQWSFRKGRSTEKHSYALKQGNSIGIIF